MTRLTALRAATCALDRGALPRAGAASVLAFVLALAVPGAIAAPVTLNLDVAIGDFIEVITDTPAAFAPITGSFSITFDLAASVGPTSSGLVVNALSYLAATPLQYAYTESTHTLVIGGAGSGVGGISPGTQDFVLQILLDDPQNPSLFTCASPAFFCGTASGDSGVFASAFTSAGVNSVWFAQSGSIVNVDAVPEPASLALVGVALACLAASRPRRGHATSG